MEWLWIPSLIAGLIAGFIMGAKSFAKSIQNGLRLQAEQQIGDRNNYLCVLRRELANHLVQTDAKAFDAAYHKLHNEVVEYPKLTKERLKAELTVLCERYPQYTDFDMLGTRDHVIYPDGFSMESFEDVLEQYRSIVRFQALNAALDERWRHVKATSEKDVTHLHEYVGRLADTRLVARLKDAINIYYLARNSDSGFDYECRDFSVVMVPHVCEIRYGVHFKKTDEYGLYCSFHGDRDEPYISYYRSDSLFKEERHLMDTVTEYRDAA